jgi:hypothetical protein
LGLGLSLIVLSINPGGNFSWREQCANVERLGNETAWTPLGVIDGPFDGSVTASYTVWTHYPSGSSSLNFSITNGWKNYGANTTAFWLGSTNWTIYAVENTSTPGAWPSVPCPAAYLAEPSHPSSYGGTIWATLSGPQQIDLGPWEINSSIFCLQWARAPGCAVDTMMDLNFTSPAAGTVNTCGLAGPESLSISSGPLAIWLPFSWQGQHLRVPVDYYGVDASIPSSDGGFESFETYSFPANGGIWNYSFLQGSPAPGEAHPTAALAFSYSPCPS